MPSASGAGVSGILLTGVALARELKADRIFTPGSWDTRGRRASGYDIRVARDAMVIPGQQMGSAQRAYADGEFRATDVILEPGQSAFFSSEERFQVDWSISAVVGAKFSQAAKGLLVLTGSVVDPGYGLVRAPNGKWAPGIGQRLHFIVANVGPRAIVLRPGIDRIAVVQFFKSDPVPIGDRQEVMSSGFAAITDSLFGPEPDAKFGLAYFRSVGELRAQFADLREEYDRAQNTIRDFEERIGRVEANTNSVVVFGVYLIAATLMGIVLAALLQLAGGLSEVDNPIVAVFAGLACALYGISVVGLLISAIRAFRRRL